MGNKAWYKTNSRDSALVLNRAAAQFELLTSFLFLLSCLLSKERVSCVVDIWQTLARAMDRRTNTQAESEEGKGYGEERYNMIAGNRDDVQLTLVTTRADVVTCSLRDALLERGSRTRSSMTRLGPSRS